ncbi:MAG: hypothetical protein AB1598_03820 [Thermodesulfobacteriota bacterium]
MSSAPRQIRILALDLGTKEIGYALLEDDMLMRYGVRNFKKRTEKQRKPTVPGIDLVKTYKPDVVILGKLSHPERIGNPMLKKLANRIIQFARKQGTVVHEIESSTARKFLVKDRRPTKMNTAVLVAATYPELSARLPHKGRILWTQKDKYWMNMFDALTLALAYLQKRKRRKAAATYLNFNNKTI